MTPQSLQQAPCLSVGPQPLPEVSWTCGLRLSRSDGHHEPAWCRSLLSPSALLRPLVVKSLSETPIPVRPPKTAGFITHRLGGEAPSFQKPTYHRGREPCAGSAANWVTAREPRGAGARPGAFHLFKANGSHISHQVFHSLFVQRNEKQKNPKKRVLSAVRNYSIKKHTEFLLRRKGGA